jgi:hypothetical protein
MLKMGGNLPTLQRLLLKLTVKAVYPLSWGLCPQTPNIGEFLRQKNREQETKAFFPLPTYKKGRPEHPRTAYLLLALCLWRFRRQLPLGVDITIYGPGWTTITRPTNKVPQGKVLPQSCQITGVSWL